MLVNSIADYNPHKENLILLGQWQLFWELIQTFLPVTCARTGPSPTAVERRKGKKKKEKEINTFSLTDHTFTFKPQQQSSSKYDFKKLQTLRPMIVEKTATAERVLMACTMKRYFPVLQKNWEPLQQWVFQPENGDEYQFKKKKKQSKRKEEKKGYHNTGLWACCASPECLQFLFISRSLASAKDC